MKLGSPACDKDPPNKGGIKSEEVERERLVKRIKGADIRSPAYPCASDDIGTGGIRGHQAGRNTNATRKAHVIGEEVLHHVCAAIKDPHIRAPARPSAYQYFVKCPAADVS